MMREERLSRMTSRLLALVNRWMEVLLITGILNQGVSWGITRSSMDILRY